jgi:hypothetical protein
MSSAASALKAQNDTIIEGMKWYLRKSEALDSARAQGKQVLLLWGRFTCRYSQATESNIGHEPIKSIVDENYVLWLSECDKYTQSTPEVRSFLVGLPTENVLLPVLCVIDMFDEPTPYGLSWGPQYIGESPLLLNLLNQYVDNDHIDVIDNSSKISISQGSLVIKSEAANEVVSVYSVTGALIDKFRKTGYDYVRDASSYPSGVLIVTGSSGWTQKIFFQ